MKRSLKLMLAAGAAFALLAGIAPTGLQAQNPPSERDVQIYAGLHAAAANGDVAELERLVGEGEKVDIQDARSRTPLIVAAYRRHHKAAEALLRLGANPNARDSDRFNMLAIAVAQNDMEMFKLALAHGANPGAVTGPYDNTALISAAHLGHVEMVKALIEAKAPLDHVNALGWTALIMAVVLGNGDKDHVATVEALVNAKADTEIKDRAGMTALAHARARNYADMVKILQAVSGRKT
jgi:ankyrin repeat protein